MIDVFDHTDIPEQVGPEDVVPQKLPCYGWNPGQLLAFGSWNTCDLAYHSHPRRHKPGDV